jgi:hypothetical protein
MKENLKLTASNVLGSAYRQRVVVRNNPDDKIAILAQFRNFRKYMVQFFNIAKQIRGFSARNSEIEVLGKEIEELVSTLDAMKLD